MAVIQLQLACGNCDFCYSPFRLIQNSMDCIVIVLATATTDASQTIAPTLDGALKTTCACNLVCGNRCRFTAAGCAFLRDANQRPLTMCADGGIYPMFSVKCAVHCLHCATLATINITYSCRFPTLNLVESIIDEDFSCSHNLRFILPFVRAL